MRASCVLRKGRLGPEIHATIRTGMLRIETPVHAKRNPKAKRKGQAEAATCTIRSAAGIAFHVGVYFCIAAPAGDPSRVGCQKVGRCLAICGLSDYRGRLG